jgi:hypothetical protein
VSDSKEVVVQGSLSPEVFSRFINLKVGMSLSGSASFDLEALEKVLSGDPLGKGTELVITALYYVKDIRMPVKRKEDYSRPYEERCKGLAYQYELGGAKIELALIAVEKVEGKQGKMKQAIAAPCKCLVKIEPNVTKPDKHRVADYPLKGFWSLQGCDQCRGKGYVFPRENKAPLSDEVRSSYGSIIVLVDELPEPPDIPEGGCQTCGSRGHKWSCPVKAQEEAAAKAADKAAKKATKKPKTAPAPVEQTDTETTWPPEGGE